MEPRQSINGLKRKFNGSDDKVSEVKEKKLKETKLKESEENALLVEARKNIFLTELYGEQPVYYRDLKKDFKGELLIDRKDELRLTLQVKKLADSLKAEHLKYLQGDTKAVKVKKWDELPPHYFSSFMSGSFFYYSAGLSAEEKQTRDKKRRIMFQQGKECLEALLFMILEPLANRTLAKKALCELYLKIGVCSPGFITDLQTALEGLSPNFDTLFADKRLEVCKQAASIFTSEIIKRREKSPLSPESTLKELSRDDLQFTHAVSELTDYISATSPFSIPKSLDINAENFFSDPEKKEFKEKFLAPNNLYHCIIEAFCTHYLTIMNDVNSIETLDHFFNQLNQLGHLDEVSSTYFEEDPIRVKNSEEVIEALRDSILKRILISNRLGEMFVKRSEHKIGEEDKLCDVVITNIPYIKNAENQNQYIFDRLPQNGRPYSYLLQDRNIYCFTLTDEKYLTIENFENFLPHSILFAYVILKKDDHQHKLYFVQRNPENIREVSLDPQRTKLFYRLVEDLPENKNPYPSRINVNVEKLKSLDPEERHEKVIHFVNKKIPGKAYKVLDKDMRKFDKILLKLKVLAGETKKTVFTEQKSLSIIAEHTKHVLYDTLYLNHHNVFDSIVVSPRMLLESENSVLMISDYFKKITDDERYLILKELKSQNIDLQKFLVAHQIYLSKELLQKTFGKLETSRLIKSSINQKNYSLALQLLKATPIKLPTKYTNKDFYKKAIIQLIVNDDAEKIKILVQFCKKVSLSLSLSLNQMHFIFVNIAAKYGKINALQALLQILEENNLAFKKTQKEMFKSTLMSGLIFLIDEEKYNTAKEFMTRFSHFEFVNDMLLPKLISKVQDYCDGSKEKKLDKLLSNFPIDPQNLQSFFFKAANDCDKPIIDIFMKHGLDNQLKDEDEQGFSEHLESGLYDFIMDRAYGPVLDLMIHYSVSTKIFLGVKDYIQDELKLLAKDSSTIGIANRNALIQLIKRFPEALEECLRDEKQSDKFPAITILAAKGCVEAFQELVQIPSLASEFKKNPEMITLLGFSITIHMAIQKPNYDAIEWLIKKFPDICTETNNIYVQTESGKVKMPPFTQYILSRNNASILNMINKYCPRALSLSFSDNRTCLSYTLLKNNDEMSKFLIDAKVDLSFQDNDGNSYFHFACKAHNYEMVRYLINAGAPFDLKNNLGITPFSTDMPLNLRSFLVIQILKKYIELNHGGNKLQLFHLNYIVECERSNQDISKIDWGHVFANLSRTKKVSEDGSLSSMSLFSRTLEAPSDYLKIVNNRIINFEVYQSICSSIRDLQPKEMEIEIKPLPCKG